MADGHVDGDNLICGLHGWDYRIDTGVSEYNNAEVLHKFEAWIEDDAVWVDQDDISTGAHWDQAVEQALREAKSVVVALTPASVGSQNGRITTLVSSGSLSST